jgi:hypothetical protein
MLAAEAALAGNTGFFMFNMLRYKPQAEYGPLHDFEPCTGQEAYFNGLQHPLKPGDSGRLARIEQWGVIFFWYLLQPLSEWAVL